MAHALSCQQMGQREQARKLELVQAEQAPIHPVGGCHRNIQQWRCGVTGYRERIKKACTMSEAKQLLGQALIQGVSRKAERRCIKAVVDRIAALKNTQPAEK